MRFAAISKDILVRVEFSKKKFTKSFLCSFLLEPSPKTGFRSECEELFFKKYLEASLWILLISVQES
jgi:hypothetical protein